MNFDELKVGDSTIWGRHGICNDTARDPKAGTVGYLDARGPDEGTADFLFRAPTDRYPCFCSANRRVGVRYAKAILMIESDAAGGYPAWITGMVLSRSGRQNALNVPPGQG